MRSNPRPQFTPTRIRSRRGPVDHSPPMETLLAIHRVYQGVRRIMRRKAGR